MVRFWGVEAEIFVMKKSGLPATDMASWSLTVFCVHSASLHTELKGRNYKLVWGDDTGCARVDIHAGHNLRARCKKLVGDHSRL